MASTLTKTRPRREAKNTYGLPTGEKIRREQVRVFREQRRAVLAWIDDGFEFKREPDIPAQFPDWEHFRLGALAVSERMTPLLESIWDEAGQKFTSRIGLDPDSWEVTNPKTQEAIDRAALAFCQETNDTTSLMIDEALQQTREALTAGLVTHGESLAQLTKRIQRIFDGSEKWRARRIAASESSRAVHSAQEQVAKESGVVTGWKLLISEDACPLCQTVKRRVPAVKLGQPFAIIGKNPAYSSIKFPPIHPSCQCSLEEVLDIDPQPKWADTLHDPEPEEEDYAPGEAPERARKLPPPVAVKPKPAAPVKPRRKLEPEPEPQAAIIEPRSDPVPAMPIIQFAARILDAARSVPVDLRYGEDRVWIIDAFQEFMKVHPEATVETFKERLIEANQERLVTLAEMDLPHKLSPEERAKREASEVTQLRAVNHFIRLPK